jgi:molecular chaperone DnaK (HSP70)
VFQKGSSGRAALRHQRVPDKVDSATIPVPVGFTDAIEYKPVIVRQITDRAV